MHFYILTIAYDGTSFFGWQWQPHHSTIQKVLYDTITRVFNRKKILLVGASRTDAGVHAHGQVARLGMELGLDPQKLQHVLNKALPAEIKIQSSMAAPVGFHPQHNILYKIYSYRFFTHTVSPLHGRYGWTLPFRVERTVLESLLPLFVGRHDFALFAKESAKKNTVKEVISLELSECKLTGGYIFTCVGKSFLHQMIRRMVGTLLVSAAKYPLSAVDDVRNMLLPGASYARHGKNLLVAPAHGLCLEKIVYNTTLVK